MLEIKHKLLVIRLLNKILLSPSGQNEMLKGHKIVGNKNKNEPSLKRFQLDDVPRAVACSLNEVTRLPVKKYSSDLRVNGVSYYSYGQIESHRKEDIHFSFLKLFCSKYSNRK